MVVHRVREDGILEVHSMGDHIVIFIHPVRQEKRIYIVHTFTFQLSRAKADLWVRVTYSSMWNVWGRTYGHLESISSPRRTSNVWLLVQVTELARVCVAKVKGKCGELTFVHWLQNTKHAQPPPKKNASSAFLIWHHDNVSHLYESCLLFFWRNL